MAEQPAFPHRPRQNFERLVRVDALGVQCPVAAQHDDPRRVGVEGDEPVHVGDETGAEGERHRLDVAGPRPHGPRRQGPRRRRDLRGDFDGGGGREVHAEAADAALAALVGFEQFGLTGVVEREQEQPVVGRQVEQGFAHGQFAGVARVRQQHDVARPVGCLSQGAFEQVGRVGRQVGGFEVGRQVARAECPRVEEIFVRGQPDADGGEAGRVARQHGDGRAGEAQPHRPPRPHPLVEQQHPRRRLRRVRFLPAEVQQFVLGEAADELVGVQRELARQQSVGDAARRHVGVAPLRQPVGRRPARRQGQRAVDQWREKRRPDQPVARAKLGQRGRQSPGEREQDLRDRHGVGQVALAGEQQPDELTVRHRPQSGVDRPRRVAA